MYIAIDDTDSKSGMCTTFLATELIKEFSELSLLDFPRLVRLNPNVPWKTRGNGAVVLELGYGKNKKNVIGEIDGETALWDGESALDEDVFQRTIDVVSSWAETDREGTDPGVVVGNIRPDIGLYHKGVTDIVTLEEVTNILDDLDLRYWGMGNRRGIIGAAAALAWVPLDCTYELISYRKRENWGTSRRINRDEVIALDKATKYTFDTFDYRENKQAIAPSSPCPVLYGVRGDEHEELKKSLGIIKSEEPERYLIFLTNQGTDDHIRDTNICDIRSYLSVHIRCSVASSPITIEGGHVLFEVTEDGSTITAAAYEPTKSFRGIVRQLIIGDEIELWGGIREEPLTVNVERLKVNNLVKKITKIANPECDSCGKRMSSVGKDAGYRCKRCSTKGDEDDALTEVVERKILEGWYEVPVVARRHLTKPLKRMCRGKEGYC